MYKFWQENEDSENNSYLNLNPYILKKNKANKSRIKLYLTHRATTQYCKFLFGWGNIGAQYQLWSPCRNR